MSRSPRAAPSVPINEAVREYSRTAADWQFRAKVAWLHEWAARLNRVFGLRIETPVLHIEHLSRRGAARYHPGRNAAGLRFQISLDPRRLNEPRAWQLAWLFLELLRQWQDRFGRPGQGDYANRELQAKCSAYGLQVGRHAQLEAVRTGPFTKLLARYAIDVDVLAEPPPLPGRRDEKMKKWSCACMNIRAATVVNATCNFCNRRFQRAVSPAGKGPVFPV
jgi:hypothetical protein